jgi:hypothetical protein
MAQFYKYISLSGNAVGNLYRCAYFISHLLVTVERTSMLCAADRKLWLLLAYFPKVGVCNLCPVCVYVYPRPETFKWLNQSL